ncbi:MAG: hypothetical protein GYA33_06030, partial [Thermogutta sp.]|nr:hypothetical protein [Thermogutta sp.]
SVPLPETRAAVRQLLETRWSEEPDGLFSSLEYSDPGLIPVLKDLLREHQDSAAAGYGPRPVSEAPRKKGAAAPRRPREMRLAPSAAGQVKTRWEYQAWLDETYAVVDGWMRRLGEGAIMDRRRSGKEEEAAGFPLHSSDCPAWATSLVLDSPGQGEADSQRLPLVELSYVRLADHARPETVAAYYRRMVPRARERPLQNGLWLDASATEGERWTSLDVRMTAVEPGRPRHEEQDLFVEILQVRAAVTPPEEPAAATATAAGP